MSAALSGEFHLDLLRRALFAVLIGNHQHVLHDTPTIPASVTTQLPRLIGDCICICAFCRPLVGKLLPFFLHATA